jgi:hypothetical protein
MSDPFITKLGPFATRPFLDASPTGNTLLQDREPLVQS